MAPYITLNIFDILKEAATDCKQINGLTHNFYRYPARFSPTFAGAAIQCFSKPGDRILDCYMGGGTSVVEALAAGRRVIGNDINSLATFVTKVKVTRLFPREVKAITDWATFVVPFVSLDHTSLNEGASWNSVPIRNMDLPESKELGGEIACILNSILELPTENSQNFARCVLLRVSQVALDGNKKRTSRSDFRAKLGTLTFLMLDSLSAFEKVANHNGFLDENTCVLNTGDAADLISLPSVQDSSQKVDLVVTSPPYPGIHMLYHRWQVDGRKETPAPYWIAGCQDGHGASYYTFGGRNCKEDASYFQASLNTLKAVRSTMKDGAHIVQMLAFSNPEFQLPAYLENMISSGFEEVSVPTDGSDRIWRDVPNRRWHANAKGRTNSSKEVVLVHRAA